VTDKITQLSLALLVILNFSCGRDIKDKKKVSNNERDINNQRTVNQATRDFIKTQSIVCEDDIFCNASIGKLIVIDRGELKYCTATLVSPDTVMTSSSCLTRSMRFAGVGCANSAVVVFPGDSFRTPTSSFCKEIIQASKVNDSSDPALRKSDIAFIRLEKEIDRKPLKLARKGFNERLTYTIWKSDFENTRRAILRSRPCIPFFNSYANPFSEKKYSPIITVFDCKFEDGNLGAPLMNIRGEVVGVLSGEIDQAVVNYASRFLIEKMANILNVSNLACVSFPWDNITPNFDLECMKSIGVNQLDRKRSLLLSNPKVHYKNMMRIKNELEVYEKYFLWNIVFKKSKSGLEYELDMGRPKCFKDINAWIGEFTRWRGRIRSYAFKTIELPRYLLKTKLNRLLYPVSDPDDLGEKEFDIEFNPYDAFFNKSTYVDITRESFGGISTLEFDNVTDNCQ
jgi:V8-like Glu-specific endopeptidase